MQWHIDLDGLTNDDRLQVECDSNANPSDIRILGKKRVAIVRHLDNVQKHKRDVVSNTPCA